MFLEDIQNSVMKLLEDVCNMITIMFSVISELTECVKTFNVTTHGIHVSDRVVLFMGSIQALTCNTLYMYETIYILQDHFSLNFCFNICFHIKQLLYITSYFRLVLRTNGWDVVVDVETGRQAGRSEVRILTEARDFSLIQNIQPGSAVHRASF